MKKLIVLLLIVISLVILEACSNNNEKNKNLGEITQNEINTEDLYRNTEVQQDNNILLETNDANEAIRLNKYLKTRAMV